MQCGFVGLFGLVVCRVCLFIYLPICIIWVGVLFAIMLLVCAGFLHPMSGVRGTPLSYSGWYRPVCACLSVPSPSGPGVGLVLGYLHSVVWAVGSGLSVFDGASGLYSYPAIPYMGFGPYLLSCHWHALSACIHAFGVCGMPLSLAPAGPGLCLHLVSASCSYVVPLTLWSHA